MKNAGKKPAAKSRKSPTKKSSKVQPKAAKTKPAAKSKPTRERDPRLPAPGTILTREHDGKSHEIKVLEQGFEYKGAHFKSLSKIAREATGTTWNGFLWLGLVKRPTKLIATAATTSPAKEG